MPDGAEIMNEIKKIERVNVLGVGISAINMDLAVRAIIDAILNKKKGYVCVTGVHGVMESQKNQLLRQIHNQSFLCTPDGMPMVWIGKIKGFKFMDRVYGPDLMLELCNVSSKYNIRHFLFGGANGVANKLKSVLENKFDGIKIVGTYEPPFRPLNETEKTSLIRTFSDLKPDITWIGLSTPKQELFMAEYMQHLNTTIMIGVGAAFDFHTGRVKQAPQWMQKNGLEWFFRLCMEPRRLWKRYLINNPLFMLLVTAQLLGLKKYSI